MRRRPIRGCLDQVSGEQVEKPSFVPSVVEGRTGLAGLFEPPRPLPRSREQCLQRRGREKHFPTTGRMCNVCSGPTNLALTTIRRLTERSEEHTSELQSLLRTSY